MTTYNILQHKLPNGEFMNYREGTTDLNCIIEVFNRKEYQHKRLGIIFEPNSQDNNIWLDCGANVGAFSKLINCSGGTVIAFEPELENFEMLKSNIDDSNNVLINSAISSSKSEKLEFYTASKETDKYRYTSIPNSRPVGKFDNICMEYLMTDKFYGIKLDIEGAELDLIDKEMIPDCNILVGEYHFSKDRDMKNFRRRMNILKKMFKTVHYQPFLDKYEDQYPLPVDKMFYCVK